ncbi:MAG: hypothetical protein IPK82_25825 [Polyangiaceae bacterium]|nr:hypothetical protein [Polyangiaceae bacterium]
MANDRESRKRRCGTRAAESALGALFRPVVVAAGAFLLFAGCGGKTPLSLAGGADGGSGEQGGSGGSGGSTGMCTCQTDQDCPTNSVCNGCTCEPAAECQTYADCSVADGCCSGECVHLDGDSENCGACGNICSYPNGVGQCILGTCALAGCVPGFSDCDLNEGNGCETAGTCICVPGSVKPCYTGPSGTNGVGACVSGIQECLGSMGWSLCQSEVTPVAEICNGVDDDCDGVVDNVADADGDGWNVCNGDCCELGCTDHPELVNPGAFEMPGNGVDDDCNGVTGDSDPPPTCTDPALETPTTSLELVKAMDLCRFTTEDAALPFKVWGVISSNLTLVDGAGAPNDVQVGVLSGFGLNVLPEYGSTLAAISSGTARDEDDPGFIYPQNGYTPDQFGNYVAGTQVSIPSGFLGADGQVPMGCGMCTNGTICATAFDSAALKVRIRTPTNARRFEVRTRMYTAEYPDNICSEYNDFFVALLKSQHPNTPADTNVAFDEAKNPFSANTAAWIVCAYANCGGGTQDLLGTGMGGWDGSLVDGGATTWSTSGADIVPGETIELTFAIWDSGDGNVDSTALVDKFRWTHVTN